MGLSLSRANNKLSFDFATYIQEREELSRDLRGVAADAAWHRRVRGSWQVMQGASGVAATIAGGLALATTPATFGLSLPVIATTAAIVGNSISAASLASSAASYGYEHVVEKDIAKRLLNMRYVIQCIAAKDKEIMAVLVRDRSSLKKPRNLQSEARKDASEDDKENTTVQTSDASASPTLSNQNGNGSVKESKPGVGNGTDSSVSASPIGIELPNAQDKAEVLSIRACQQLCEVWDKWDLATKENKKVGFDLALALVRSSGLILGTNSIIEGSKAVKQEHDLEKALMQTSEALEKETGEVRHFDPRYFSCIPSERKLPRGRLHYIDGGGGHVDMIVSFDLCGFHETLQSDSTQTMRLPENATNVKVKFRDRAGKMVQKVNRASKHQEWVKNDNGKFSVEVCDFDVADGADIVFVVKGTLTHAYIHKAWDFGRVGKPRPWEWWENAAEECRELLPNIGQRIAARPTHPPSTRQVLCCY